MATLEEQLDQQRKLEAAVEAMVAHEAMGSYMRKPGSNAPDIESIVGGLDISGIDQYKTQLTGLGKALVSAVTQAQLEEGFDPDRFISDVSKRKAQLARRIITGEDFQEMDLLPIVMGGALAGDRGMPRGDVKIEINKGAEGIEYKMKLKRERKPEGEVQVDKPQPQRQVVGFRETEEEQETPGGDAEFDLEGVKAKEPGATRKEVVEEREEDKGEVSEKPEDQTPVEEQTSEARRERDSEAKRPPDRKGGFGGLLAGLGSVAAGGAVVGGSLGAYELLSLIT